MRRATAFAVPLILATVLLLLARTDTPTPGGAERIPGTAVPVAADLREPLALSRGWIDQPPPPGPSVATYAHYRDLLRRVQTSESLAAVAEEIFLAWEKDQDNGLWLELVNSRRRAMGKGRELALMLTRPLFADTTTAFGAFAAFQSGVHGRREHWLRRAAAGSAQLTPLTRLLVEDALAYRERMAGDHAAAARRLLATLPDAWRAGGHRRVADLWQSVALTLFDADRLDGALHAAHMALSMAEAAGDPYQGLEARTRIAFTAGQRGDVAGALAELIGLGDEAWRNGWTWLAKNNLDRAAELATEQGRYADAVAIDHRSRAINVATGDLLNLPRSLASIAHGHRMTGRLDSTRIYLLRAQAVVDATDFRSNRAKMKELLAGYYCQVGQYARAESLLVAAAAAGELGDPYRAQAMLLLDLLPSALEIGRPDLAYAWLARLDGMREMLPQRVRGDNALAEFELLKARLLAEQGETRRADQALGRAAAAVQTAGGDGAAWRLDLQRGRLALQRGDLATAERHFYACLDRALRGDDPRRLARSRFQLGEVYLARGRFDDAEAMFELINSETTFGYAFRTGLTSRLLLAELHAARGDHAASAALAVDGLERAGPAGPADLRTRLGVVHAQALVALGRHAEAEAALRALAPAATPHATHFAGLRVMQRDLDRDIRETRVANVLAGGLAPAERTGRTTLEIAYPGLAARLAAGDRHPAVVYFTGRKRSWSWLVSAGTCHVTELDGSSALARRIEPVLVDLAEPRRPLDTGRLAAVAEVLPAGLADAWRPGTTLHLVTDGPVVRIPWSALPLPGTGRVVLDHGALVEVDPAAADAARPARRPRELPILAIGSNGPDTGLPTLRRAEDEAAAIHGDWPAAGNRLLIGEDATWPGALAAGLAAAGVVHIASHAVVHQGDSERSTLRLTTDSADPAPVTMSAVRSLDLQAELVFLSSCRAGSPAPDPGRGFPGAFLAAGAGAVVAATTWVDDEAAGVFATSFYSHWRDGLAPADALAQARRTVRARWPHPSYWAFYRLVVGGGPVTAR